MDEGDWTCRNKEKEGDSCSIWDSGDLCVSQGSVRLPDVSDSDRHGGLGIQHFLIPHVPPPTVRPLHPCDKRRKCSVTSSVTLTHSLNPWVLLILQATCSRFLSHFFKSPFSRTFSSFHFLPFTLSRSSTALVIQSLDVIGTEAKRAVNTWQFFKIMDDLFWWATVCRRRGPSFRARFRRAQDSPWAALSPFPFLRRHFGFCCNSGWRRCVLTGCLFM